MNTRIADGLELQPNPPEAPMSAMGHKRTFKRGSGMSASSPRADMLSARGDREDL